jgi:hypothetical protein
MLIFASNIISTVVDAQLESVLKEDIVAPCVFIYFCLKELRKVTKHLLRLSSGLKMGLSLYLLQLMFLVLCAVVLLYDDKVPLETCRE